MPAGITHMTLSRVALDDLTSEIGQKAQMLLGQQFGPYLSGSLAPDIPYMGNFVNNPITSQYDSIADELHHSKTLQIPLHGLRLAQTEFRAGNKVYSRELFAFYTGYLSHAIADGTIHPFIRDMVGDYSPSTKTKHRALEMKLDVLVAKKYLGVEQNGVSLQQQLSYIKDAKFRDELYITFSQFLKTIHNLDLPADYLIKLADGILTALNFAEGHFFKWYTVDLKMGDNAVAYMDLEDVEKEREKITKYSEPIDSKEKGNLKNYLWKDEVSFFEDAVPQYFKIFPNLIEAAYSFVFMDGADIETLIPEVNFDTGRLAINNDLNNKAALYEV